LVKLSEATVGEVLATSDGLMEFDCMLQANMLKIEANTGGINFRFIWFQQLLESVLYSRRYQYVNIARIYYS
jgi:hypothetical protein